MKFSILASAAIVAATASARQVACLVNGSPIATVELETDNCPFTIPSNLPVFFNFVSAEEYNVEFYYSIAQNQRYFNDIVNAGEIINIPAIALYGNPGAPLYQVHLQESPASNSTAAIRKRLLGQTYVKRDAASDFAESAKSQDGTLVSSGIFEVVDIESVSSAASDATAVSSGVETIPGDATATVTEDSTTIITITSCSENKCSATEVPATKAVTTDTIQGTVTSYTTWCPVTEDDSTATATEKITTVITITSCSDNKCSATEVPATEGPTTVTKEGTVTTYTTWCPVTEATETTGATEATTEATTAAEETTKATAAEDTTAAEGTVTTEVTETATAATETAATETTAAGETTAATGAEGTTEAGETTAATATTAAEGTTLAPVSTSSAASEAPIVSTYADAANRATGSLIALAAIPLAYFL